MFRPLFLRRCDACVPILHPGHGGRSVFAGAGANQHAGRMPGHLAVSLEDVQLCSGSWTGAGLVDLHAGNGSCTPFLSGMDSVRLDKRALSKIEIDQ